MLIKCSTSTSLTAWICISVVFSLGSWGCGVLSCKFGDLCKHGKYLGSDIVDCLIFEPNVARGNKRTGSITVLARKQSMFWRQEQIA